MTDSLPLPGGPWPTLEPGWVWLCGAGPGDPGLLTLHAVNALRQADVVIYDALVEPRILDWAPQAEHIYAGKRGGKPSAVQRDISLRLVDLASEGKRVLRLKGGDPFIFGRGGEELETLAAHGVRAGDPVAIVLPNCPQHIVAFYAVLRLGAVVVEHNPLYTARELRKQFEDHGAKHAIVWSKVVKTVQEFPADLRVTTLVSVDVTQAMPLRMRLALRLPIAKARESRAALTEKTSDATPWAQLVRHDPIPDTHPRPATGDLAIIQYTSGTTGTAKGVVLDHTAVAASAEATSAALAIDPTSHRWLACLPLAHVGGLSVITRAWHTGTPLEIHDGFDADAVDDAAARGATHVSLVGTAMGRIDTSRWERIVLGGSAPPPDRPANTVATYGMTETGSGVVYDGVPLPGVEVAVVEDEIWLRGPMIARHYRDGTAVVDDDGWLHTDDAGAFADGVLHVVGRRGDCIITGGENVYPGPIEARLRAHPAVADAAVFGRPDPEWGTRVVAAIEAVGEAPTLDVLRDWVRGELPAHCAPKELEVRSLPRTALGKVRRHLL